MGMEIGKPGGRNTVLVSGSDLFLCVMGFLLCSCVSITEEMWIVSLGCSRSFFFSPILLLGSYSFSFFPIPPYVSYSDTHITDPESYTSLSHPSLLSPLWAKETCSL